MTATPRMRPRLDADNRAFWTGGADGRLHLAFCEACEQFTHPPRAVCRHCRSERIVSKPIDGTGAVETFTVNHQAWAPGMEVPFIIARVRLDHAPGVILTTNIVDCAPEDIRFDDPVRVRFEEQDGIYYPLFEKVR